MLEIALSVRRGNFHLQVECGFASEWTVIFGPSGAGKSSLLRLIAGLDRAQSGQQVQIVLDSQPMTDTARDVWVRPGQRQTSMVTQQPALFPHLSVEANIAYGLRTLDSSTRATRVNEMLELVGATGLVNRRPRELSGGEAQRVALARALAPLPRLLLLDEPFSALDGVSSDALLDRLRRWVAAHGVLTVMATHDVTDALATNAEVALLQEGRVRGMGPAAEVLAAERDRLRRRLRHE